MRYSAKRKQDISISKTPIEITIPLLEPVKIYTAKELAAMPLSKMIECRDAQEEYFVKYEVTLSIGARNARDLMKNGEAIKVTFEKKRIHTYAVFKLGGETLSKRIINQLVHRCLIKLPNLEGAVNG